MCSIADYAHLVEDAQDLEERARREADEDRRDEATEADSDDPA